MKLLTAIQNVLPHKSEKEDSHLKLHFIQICIQKQEKK